MYILKVTNDDDYAASIFEAQFDKNVVIDEILKMYEVEVKVRNGVKYEF